MLYEWNLNAPRPIVILYASCPSLPIVSSHLLTQPNLKHYPPLSEPVWGKLLLKICWTYRMGKIDFESA